MTVHQFLMVWIFLCSLPSSLCDLVLDYETTIPQFIGSDQVGQRPDPLLAQQHLRRFLQGQRNRNATKQDIYKKVLLQTLQQHRHAHRQLVTLSQHKKDLPTWNKNSVLKQWVDHTLSHHATNRIFVKLNKEKSRENYQNQYDTDTKDIQIKRNRRNSDNSGLMYIPLGGTKKKQCPTAADAAGISITQMAFLSICLTVFNIIVNISNNINNNNNNNNINSNNNLANTNAQVSSNINNANQINVMLPPPSPGKKKKRSTFRKVWETIHLPAKVMWKKCKRKIKKILQLDINVADSLEEEDNTEICTEDVDTLLEKSLLDMENHINSSKSTSSTEQDTKEFIIEKKENLDGQLDHGIPSFKIMQPIMNITVENINEFSNINFERNTTSLNVLNKINGKSHSLASASMLIGLREWLQEAHHDNSLCEGLHLCNRLENTEKSNFWVTAVISFMSHQHLQSEKSENLHDYLHSAVKQKACRKLFPQCR